MMLLLLEFRNFDIITVMNTQIFGDGGYIATCIFWLK